MRGARVDNCNNTDNQLLINSQWKKEDSIFDDSQRIPRCFTLFSPNSIDRTEKQHCTNRYRLCLHTTKSFLLCTSFYSWPGLFYCTMSGDSIVDGNDTVSTFPRIRRKLSYTMRRARGLMFPLSNGLRCCYNHTSSRLLCTFLHPDTRTVFTRSAFYINIASIHEFSFVHRYPANAFY